MELSGQASGIAKQLMSGEGEPLQSIKQRLQLSLSQLGLYHRLKASSLYSLYWSLADRTVIEDVTRELDFYKRTLVGFRSGDLIFDIGANQGYKTGIFLRLGAKVVAVDPDEANTAILEEKFLRYRLRAKPLVVVTQAVSDKCAVETMWMEGPGSAKNTLSRKWVDTLTLDDKRFGHVLHFGQRTEVTTTTLEKLFITYGMPLFVKIDVEGLEVNVIRGMQRPVPYLSFEVNLPEFRAEGLECVKLLAAIAKDGKFNYAVDCRQGLALRDWLGARDFSGVLARCADDCVEVFWKTPFPSDR